MEKRVPGADMTEIPTSNGKRVLLVGNSFHLSHLAPTIYFNPSLLTSYAGDRVCKSVMLCQTPAVPMLEMPVKLLSSSVVP